MRYFFLALFSIWSLGSISLFAEESCPKALLRELNTEYLARHSTKENQFWAQYMGLVNSVPGAYNASESTLRDWASDPKHAKRVAEALKQADLDPQVRDGLLQWQAFFAVNDRVDQKPNEGRPLKELLDDLLKAEESLDLAKKKNPITYRLPNGEVVKSNITEARLLVQTSPDEAVRKAVLESLYAHEAMVLKEGLIPIIKLRNQVARKLGFADYYEWKLKANEGMTKQELFSILDSLESRTRDACKRSVDHYVAQNGEKAKRVWNFPFFSAGKLVSELDPYFPFAKVIERFGQAFGSMGVDFQGATLTMDLVNRSTKYQNGFIRAPIPAHWLVEENRLRPAVTWFSSNAIPGQPGSGYSATHTVLHEAGHHANFANIRTPSVAGSQEESPTSIATAETQSMFFDSVQGDGDWLALYARTQDGKPMPWELVERHLTEQHRLRALGIRAMLIVPYMEKALYEMSDADLNSENILRVARETERKLLQIDGWSRPVLTVSHIHSAESSAYYHGYVMAELAVYQTREVFLKRDGKILGNKNVSPELAKAYWHRGNAVSFADMIHSFTGQPFSSDAAVRVIQTPMEVYLAEQRARFESALKTGVPTEKVNLNGHFIVAHGDVQISTTLAGKSFEQMSLDFENWINQLEAEARANPVQPPGGR